MFALLSLAIDLYSLILLGAVIASWVAPQSRHPVVVFLERATEPVLAPIRRVLPAVGGIDLSPMLLFFALRLVQRLL